LDGNHYKSITFSTFTITFVAITIVKTRRSTCYWTADGRSITTSFF
jgi:hypothetical protein